MSLNNLNKVADVIGNMSSEQDDIKENMNAAETDALATFFAGETVKITENAIRIKSRDISADAIWNADFWGSCYWEGDYANSPITLKILNPCSKYVETFYNTHYKDSLTNASWTTTGTVLFSGLGTIQTALSSSIKYNSGTVNKVTVYAEGTNSTTASYYVSADGGINWTNTGLNNPSILTVASNDLRWKVVSPGTNAVAITRLEVRY